jgi:hypothetical protein
MVSNPSFARSHDLRIACTGVSIEISKPDVQAKKLLDVYESL